MRALLSLTLLLFASPSLADRPGIPPGAAIPFVENRGQDAADVAFTATTSTGRVFVTRRGEIVHTLDTSSGLTWSLVERFSKGTPRPAGRRLAATRLSVFLGQDPSRWQAGLRTFGELDLGEVWPRIGVVLRARDRRVEKIFRLGPGADPDEIRLEIAGASALEILASGALGLGTGLGQVELTSPVAWQERADGSRQEVEVSYRIASSGYGFRLGDRDASRAVWIDPILDATYLGGSAMDAVTDVQVVGGEVYVGGTSWSSDFPGTAGGAQEHAVKAPDVVLARLSADLSTVLQATYLGGSGADGFSGPLVVREGRVYVTGTTRSADFPGTVHGAQPALGGRADAFVAVLDRRLTSLLGATYLGGAYYDTGASLAVGPTFVAIAGSSGLDLPGAENPPGGGWDAFVAMLDLDLRKLLRARYLGGTGDEFQPRILLDGERLYVAGWTRSADFPRVAGGVQPHLSGAEDGYAALLDTGLGLIQATYFGGANFDTVESLARGLAEIYLCGYSTSPDLPGSLAGALGHGGLGDGFVARLSLDLTANPATTYIGGSSYERCSGMAAEGKRIWIAGYTNSTDLPGTAGGVLDTYQGGATDLYAALFDWELRTLLQATYLGGSGLDGAVQSVIFPTGIAVELAASGEPANVYIAAATESADFPTTPGAFQPGPAVPSVADGAIARLKADLRDP